jgi:hypothetical protein
VNAVPLWRVFPWDPAAAEGDRFSAAFIPGGQGRNRFDLPGKSAGVVYFAESEVHAVAELLQRFRNSPEPLTSEDLTSWGHTLALVQATLDPAIWPGVVDLCDPATLTAFAITADQPPSRERSRTQGIALNALGKGHAGLRWWSVFWGEWHTVVLFRERLTPDALTYGRPTPLDIRNPAVIEAASLLDIG